MIKYMKSSTFLYNDNIMIIPLLAIIIIVFIFYTLTEIINRGGINRIDSVDMIEGYNGRISKITKEKCGSLCTRTIGCAGFGYDEKTERCYLSQKPIDTRPVAVLYADEYLPHHDICNKKYVIDSDKNIHDDNMKYNAIYTCTDDEKGAVDTLMIKDDNITPIFDDNKLKELKVDTYALKTINWPSSRIDIEFERPNRDDAQFSKIFVKRENEYLGQYMYPHMCVANIPELECIKHCAKNQECSGVEWNPFMMDPSGENQNRYKIYKNICCPKSTIDKIIPRRELHMNGSFYEKLSSVDNIHDLSTDKERIFITY